jgi:hypothetical protein
VAAASRDAPRSSNSKQVMLKARDVAIEAGGGNNILVCER